MDDDGTDLPTDVLVHILQRLQPNDRRRLRLVCRNWRHVVDTRTATSLRSSVNMLLVTVDRMYVFDELSLGLRSWEMPVWPGRYTLRNEVVGTCNGIVCICDDFLGRIFLYNPVTRDKLAIPNPPPRYQSGARTFSFTHDPSTGRYMVVHITRYDRVVVFTLGEAAWRDVDIPCLVFLHYGDGFVTIKSTMYWVEQYYKCERVRSLDLNNERAPSAIPLPSPRLAGTCRLTEVLGMLGIVFSCLSGKMDKVEVWVMERDTLAEANHGRWSRWYSVQIQRIPRHQPQWHDHQHLAWPHFAHGINHVLTWKWLPTGGCALYRHRASNGTVVINERNQGTLVAHIETKYDTFQRFDYVQTMEPLSVYKCW